MAAATAESGGSGGPYKGVIGRHFGYTGDPEFVAQAAGSGYALLVEDTVVATSRAPIFVSAAGSNGAGPITVAGTLVGDKVLMVLQSTFANASASFESTVSVAGQVQQTSGSNLSGNTYLFIVLPQS